MTTTRAGRQWPAELTVTKDPVSGATVRQLTNYRAHSNHSYLTYPCWYDSGRKLVIASDRDNRVNLFGVDLDSGVLTQLTDWDPARVTNRHSLSKNPVREEIAFYYDNAVHVLDLATLTTRRLLECPKATPATWPTSPPTASPWSRGSVRISPTASRWIS